MLCGFSSWKQIARVKWMKSMGEIGFVGLSRKVESIFPVRIFSLHFAVGCCRLGWMNWDSVTRTCITRQPKIRFRNETLLNQKLPFRDIFLSLNEILNLAATCLQLLLSFACYRLHSMPSQSLDWTVVFQVFHPFSPSSSSVSVRKKNEWIREFGTNLTHISSGGSWANFRKKISPFSLFWVSRGECLAGIFYLDRDLSLISSPSFPVLCRRPDQSKRHDPTSIFCACPSCLHCPALHLDSSSTSRPAMERHSSERKSAVIHAVDWADSSSSCLATRASTLRVLLCPCRPLRMSAARSGGAMLMRCREELVQLQNLHRRHRQWLRRAGRMLRVAERMAEVAGRSRPWRGCVVTDAGPSGDAHSDFYLFVMTFCCATLIPCKFAPCHYVELSRIHISTTDTLSTLQKRKISLKSQILQLINQQNIDSTIRAESW